jgi:membrane-bound lytic murein transglycosylase B
VDAIGSVANFLKIHGWQRGEPTVFPATIVDAAKADNLINQGLEAKYSPDEISAGGVVAGAELPAGLRYGVIDLQNGGAPTDYWLATNNFFAITQYNRSYFYAMSVIDLARAVRTARGQ